jgi:hypothetical protein
VLSELGYTLTFDVVKPLFIQFSRIKEIAELILLPLSKHVDTTLNRGYNLKVINPNVACLTNAICSAYCLFLQCGIPS